MIAGSIQQLGCAMFYSQLTQLCHPALQVRRLIKGGGVYFNNTKVTEQDKVVHAEDLIDGKMLLLAAGKKNKMLVRISS
jgi:tyrosyl-tRNA synthetase